MRGLEGLPQAAGWLRGDGPTELRIREHDWTLTLDVAEGHKTGFYLDQRDNRSRVAPRSSGGRPWDFGGLEGSGRGPRGTGGIARTSLSPGTPGTLRPPLLSEGSPSPNPSVRPR